MMAVSPKNRTNYYRQEREAIVAAVGEAYTVDIWLEARPDAQPERIREAMEGAGYRCSSEKEEPDFRMMFLKGYTLRGFAERVVHLHVRRPGDWDELYFRDYLREHPGVVGEYAALKKELMERYRHDRDAYTEAKTAFIREATAAARKADPGRYAISAP